MKLPFVTSLPGQERPSVTVSFPVARSLPKPVDARGL